VTAGPARRTAGDGLERMRLVRDDIADRVSRLTRRLRAGQEPAGRSA